jgi:hypothetical protein
VRLPPPRDWRQAIAQLKEGFQLCEECSALPLLQKDLGLISCRSGDLKNGLAELLEAQELASQGADIEQAIRMIRARAKPDLLGASGKGPQGFSFPVVNLFSEEIQNVSLSGL